MTHKVDELIHPSLLDHMYNIKHRNEQLKYVTNQEGRAEREFNEALKIWTRGLTDTLNKYNSKN